MSRHAGRMARLMKRATLSDASKRVQGDDPKPKPLDRAEVRCTFCPETRVTRLRVGLLGGVAYGTYCTTCGKDGRGKW